MEHAVAIIGADGHVGRHLAALAEGDGLETRRVGRNGGLASALAGAAALAAGRRRSEGNPRDLRGVEVGA